MTRSDVTNVHGHKNYLAFAQMHRSWLTDDDLKPFALNQFVAYCVRLCECECVCVCVCVRERERDRVCMLECVCMWHICVCRPSFHEVYSIGIVVRHHDTIQCAVDNNKSDVSDPLSLLTFNSMKRCRDSYYCGWLWFYISLSIYLWISTACPSWYLCTKLLVFHFLPALS